MVALVAQQESVVAGLVSRTGRHLQRYNHKGRRQVVGCIPYRYNKVIEPTVSVINEEDLEVLLISSQKGEGMYFPKGGWETDESIIQAASRETIEEAGVKGIVEHQLGKWNFKSRSRDTKHEGYMFPLYVQEQLDIWPEKNVRERVWMSVSEARKVCQHCWMKEALDILVRRITSQQQQELVEEENMAETCSVC